MPVTTRFDSTAQPTNRLKSPFYSIQSARKITNSLCWPTGVSDWSAVTLTVTFTMAIHGVPSGRPIGIRERCAICTRALRRDPTFNKNKQKRECCLLLCCQSQITFTSVRPSLTLAFSSVGLFFLTFYCHLPLELFDGPAGPYSPSCRHFIGEKTNHRWEMTTHVTH